MALRPVELFTDFAPLAAGTPQSVPNPQTQKAQTQKNQAQQNRRPQPGNVTKLFGPLFNSMMKRAELWNENKNALPEGEILSLGNRGLMFRFVEDADVYQMNVIDMSDGSVVRKIPQDEALRIMVHLREHMQAALKTEELEEQLNVLA